MLGAVLTVAACGSPRPAAPPAPAEPPRPVPVAQAVPADTAALVAADDALGADLLGSDVVPETGNLVVSPVSLATVLQMIGSGAAGHTGQEIARVLHQPDGVTPAETGGGVLQGLAAAEQDGHNELRVSDTVWAQQGLAFLPAYTAILHDRFAAAVDEADFAGDPESARDRIDSTVASQTDGRIPQLFPAGSFDGTTRLVLTNAISLVASWATAFPADRTAPQPFTRADGSTVDVPMMRNDSGPNAKLGYAAGPGYQVVTLPYAGGKLAFSVLLPTGRSLDPLLDTLRAKGLPSMLGAVAPAPVSLSMPRFTIRSNLDLTGTLARAGMAGAFSDTADFSGMTTAEQLKIGTVRHDVVVQVDEHGTVAAAASGGEVKAATAAPNVAVDVDHPFLFVITDTATGSPLFLGRVTDPGA